MESNLDVDTILKIAEKIQQLKDDEYVHLTDTFIDGKPLGAFEDILTELQSNGIFTMKNDMGNLDYITFTPIDINRLQLYLHGRMGIVLSNQ
jgi:hypothetical protein